MRPFFIFIFFSSIRFHAHCSSSSRKTGSSRGSVTIEQHKYNIFAAKEFAKPNSFTSKLKLLRRRGN